MSEVTVVEKAANDTGYFITIVEATGLTYSQTPNMSKFELQCDEITFDDIQVGDIINCSRYQSVMTHKGELIEISNILSHD